MAKYNELTVGQMEAAINMMGGWEKFQSFLRGEFKLNHVAATVNDAYSNGTNTVVIPAIMEMFVAAEMLVISTKPSARVKISHIGANFTAWFLKRRGKIEEPNSEQILRYHNLWVESADTFIIKGLGGEMKAETTLSEMFSLMEKQRYGEAGVLLNKAANMFYIRDRAGVLRRIHMYWWNNGWEFEAYPVEPEHGFGLKAGPRFFSRNSILEPLETSVPAQV